MKFKKSILAFILLFACMTKVNAEIITVTEDSEFKVVAQTTKYYKTTSVLGNSDIMVAAEMNEVSSITVEISEEEYRNAPTEDGISPQTYTETSYKRLVSTIWQNAYDQFKYSATLTWKNMPATRSYDIMGLGFYASVKILGGESLKQNYCMKDGTCYTKTAGFYNYRGKFGYGAMFQLPSGELSSLSQDIQVIVAKTDPNTTVIEQVCAADYSHAQKVISYNLAKEFAVGSDGIGLYASIDSYYDSMASAIAKWNGKW